MNTYFDKFNNSSHQPKVGVAISTYTEEKTESKRLTIIKKSLDSLKTVVSKSNLPVYVILVVDGPVPQRHLDLLKQYNFNIHIKTENKGVACAKNTSIRLLLEQNIDIGFLMDDDVLYQESCFKKYCDYIIRGKIHHMGFCYPDPIVHPKSEWNKMGYIKDKINGVSVMRHGGGGVGCLLTFTPELIKKIGYFKVLPGKYGYEHINFTHRCVHHKVIPFPNDFEDSYKYIKHLGFEPEGYNKYNKCHSISEKTRLKENNKNKYLWKNNFDQYVENIE